METMALFGASGVIGQSVARALQAQGRGYRVVGRSEGSLRREFGADPRAEVVTWNPEDPASIRAAARGVRTLIYMVGVNYWQFHLHPELMRRTLDAAIAEGVERVVLIGTVYPYGLPRAATVTESHPREPNSYKGRMRKAQEDLLLEADAAGRIKGTILRLPDFYGSGVERSFLYRAFVAANQGKRAPLIGPLDAPHEFVFVDDVGPIVTALMDEPRAYGRFWNLAGAGVTTQREMVKEMYAQAGHAPKTMTMGKGMVRLAGLFDPFMRELVEMYYLLTNPVLLDDSALRGLLGTVHKTPYAEGIRQTLAALRREQEAKAAPARAAATT
ncbi:MULTISPECIES: NAD-dependent epimerase/dehydratase family protein [unclassified Corallococcus]|uniref:NAD-dependent epimerase/dehydratase family protein n=1 Tax=unclassified Corallococcus TaxID=2685029 RepID=UPI001A8DF13A|nr:MULTISPECIES: NAD-dependent epimerase/dehydratase family protein [unclassified Corallococcus]MBN9686459.1 NAD-dependent epimerase/dehydratase family protein [Corallococcus sp. NCSPR001]WAS82113.1 NAD-dependent epimerase/dehydratase family protein [Corallococcus sp. NCRR]